MATSRSGQRSTWQHVLGAWIALAVLMSANGVFREMVLREHTGAAAAAVLSALLGAALILVTTRILYPDLRRHSTAGLWRISLVTVGMTVAFETALGRLVDHRSWEELLAHYAFWRGELWPFVLLVLALTPFIWGRWTPRRRAAATGIAPAHEPR